MVTKIAYGWHSNFINNGCIYFFLDIFPFQKWKNNENSIEMHFHFNVGIIVLMVHDTCFTTVTNENINISQYDSSLFAIFHHTAIFKFFSLKSFSISTFLNSSSYSAKREIEKNRSIQLNEKNESEFFVDSTEFLQHWLFKKTKSSIDDDESMSRKAIFTSAEPFIK